MQVTGEGGDEPALRAPSVEADVERLAEFKVPLRKGTGVEVLEERKFGGVRVGVCSDSGMVFFVRE